LPFAGKIISTMENLRKYPRVDKSLDISYQRLRDFTRTSSRSKNISEAGIRLPVFQRFEAGTSLKLVINFQDYAKPVEAIGEVVWFKESGERQYPFEIGIKFVQIKPEELKRLTQHLR
jgi:Tfp pilus assembly protein PilZ